MNSRAISYLFAFLFSLQDNFQKLMQIQYSLNGHHEIVQPGRVGPPDDLKMTVIKVQYR